MKKTILATAFTLVGIVAVSAQTTSQQPATASAQASTQTQAGGQWNSDVAKEAQTATTKATTTIDGATATVNSATEAAPSVTAEGSVETTKPKGTAKAAKKAKPKSQSK
ncbi:hypothetical protein [Chryseobacterium sp. ERMR1:04]|uniref:hypothetical protein n=1 Tax=Chryseobacterium sp. ERMR1:04 TaxID=1705393 RepID=UPI0006C8DB93|nr:hypothetical protein [Chryseobacterium sp. ERMR1:04]KPH11653.1 hypothetical protein AMQ68_19925 [Chryseobacterium sp. ERMR1:04]